MRPAARPTRQSLHLDPGLRLRHPALFAMALILCCLCADAFYLAAPSFVHLMGQDWGLTEAQLGRIVTAQVLGSIAGNLLVASVLTRLSTRHLLASGLLTLVLGYSLLAGQPAPLLAVAVAALAGLGGGVVSSVALRFLGTGERATANLSLFMASENLWGVLLLSVVLPALGTAGLALGLIAAIPLGGLVFVRLFQPGEPLITEGSDAGGHLHRRGAWLCLAAVFCLYAGVGVVWTFLEGRAASAGLPAERGAQVIALGTLLSVACSWLVPWLVNRGWRWPTTVALLLACAGCIAALAMPQTLVLNIAATIGFILLWTGATMLQFSTLSHYDGVGRHIALAPAVLSTGYAVGSAAGGELIERVSAAHAFGAAGLCCLLAAAVHLVLRWSAPETAAASDKPHPPGSLQGASPT